MRWHKPGFCWVFRCHMRYQAFWPPFWLPEGRESMKSQKKDTGILARAVQETAQRNRTHALLVYETTSVRALSVEVLVGAIPGRHICQPRRFCRYHHSILQVELYYSNPGTAYYSLHLAKPLLWLLVLLRSSVLYTLHV